MPTRPDTIPIVVMAGQSNANNGDIIEATFRQVAEAGGLLVHRAVNGSPLSSRLDSGGGDWSAGSGVGEGEHLAALMKQLDSILNPASASYLPGAYLASVIWVHGGADIYTYNSASNYQANLAALNTSLTNRYGSHELVIAGMADASLQNRNLPENLASNWLKVQTAQENLARADPMITLVDPDQIAQANGIASSQMFVGDYIHYSDKAGFATLLGDALADAALPTASQRAGAVALTAANADRYFTGTSGSDRFTVRDSGIFQVLGNGGFDSVELAERASGVTVSILSGTNHRIVGNSGGPELFVDLIMVESLRLTAGKDQVAMGGTLSEVFTMGGNDRVGGSAAAERIFLGDGHDYAFGFGGNDKIYGERGNDTIWGDTGYDELFGGAGNDRLFGGKGHDTLTGGSGADVFVFSAAEGRDVITDFQNGEDKLWMRGQEWSDMRFVAVGNDTHVKGDKISVLLLNVSVDMMDISDFLFTA